MKTPNLPPYLVARPRYLRAIPSLMLLTTAMAWGMSPDGTDNDVLQKRARVSLAQGHAATGTGGNAVVDRLLKDGKKAG